MSAVETRGDTGREAGEAATTPRVGLRHWGRTEQHVGQDWEWGQQSGRDGPNIPCSSQLLESWHAGPLRDDPGHRPWFLHTA